MKIVRIIGIIIQWLASLYGLLSAVVAGIIFGTAPGVPMVLLILTVVCWFGFALLINPLFAKVPGFRRGVVRIPLALLFLLVALIVPAIDALGSSTASTFESVAERLE